MSGSLFSATMWADSAEIRHGIYQHPFVAGLFDGSLPRPAFDYYVEQDAHYLTGYAAALSACAAQSDGAASAFWAGAARETVEIEQSLHRDHFHGQPLPDRSTDCAAYVSFLLDLAGAASLPTLTAAVLPCFWIFSDLGARSGGKHLAGHPYASWIQTYRDPQFAVATSEARAIVDDLAAGSPPSVRAAMLDAFRRACRYERLLFDDAWATGAEPADGATATPTPLPGRLNGSANASATTNEVSDADNHG